MIYFLVFILIWEWKFEILWRCFLFWCNLYRLFVFNCCVCIL